MDIHLNMEFGPSGNYLTGAFLVKSDRNKGLFCFLMENVSECYASLGITS